MLERMVERVTSRYPIEKLLPLCEEAIHDDRPAAINMRAEDWENRPNTLLHCIYKQKRYDDRAGYYIYRENGKIVAGHGYYPFDEDPNMYVQSRVYSVPSHIKALGRDKMTTSNQLGSLIADKALTEGYIGGIITLEEYNSELADKIVRITDPKRYPNYYYDTELINGRVCKPRHYKDCGLRTQPMKKYGTCIIKGTRQIVLYHLFDDSYKDELFKILDKIRAE
jgi:hypothetical protein